MQNHIFTKLKNIFIFNFWHLFFIFLEKKSKKNERKKSIRNRGASRRGSNSFLFSKGTSRKTTTQQSISVHLKLEYAVLISVGQSYKIYLIFNLFCQRQKKFIASPAMHSIRNYKHENRRYIRDGQFHHLYSRNDKNVMIIVCAVKYSIKISK